LSVANESFLSDEDLLDRGLTCQVRGDFQGAVHSFSELLRRRPSEEAAFVQLLQALLKLDKHEKALPFTVKGLSLHPNSRKLHYIKGVIHYKLGQYSDSELELKNAHELDPNDPEPLLALAMVYIHTNRESLAATFLRTALDLDQDHGLAQYVLGIVLMKMDQALEAKEILAQSISSFEAVTAMSEEYLDGLFLSGSAMLMTGKYQEAVTRLERAVGLLEKKETIRSHLAQFFPVDDLFQSLYAAYIKCGMLDEARALLEKRQGAK